MAEAAPEQLREAIILGELTPGTPLRLEDLARTLGMSISPIREAVRQLEAHGLAEHVPHHGAKVTGLDVEELRELFSIRLALESMAVTRAAELFSADDEQRARARLAAFDDARRRGDIRTAGRAHTDFHFALYEAARSGWLLGLIRPAWDSCERYRPVLLGAGAGGGGGDPGPSRGARRRAARSLHGERGGPCGGRSARPSRARERDLLRRAAQPLHLRVLTSVTR